MNIFTYGIRQKEFKINLTGSINIEASKIYKYFRESNWHSKYLHSHTLQEAIISVIASEKSYNELKKMYEKDKTSLKGEPKEPKYRKKDIVEIVFTKYAIRYEGKYIKLSLSKEMQKKYQVKSLNLRVPSKLRKLVDFEHVKMIKIRKIQGKIELNIIYEKETGGFLCLLKFVKNSIFHFLLFLTGCRMLLPISQEIRKILVYPAL